MNTDDFDYSLQGLLTERYRDARRAWAASPAVQAAAATIGMSEFDYCLWFVRTQYPGPVAWADSPLELDHYAAFEAAGQVQP